MKKTKMITKNTSRGLLLRNLQQENINRNIYITFKYIINRKKLKNFQKRKK